MININNIEKVETYTSQEYANISDNDWMMHIPDVKVDSKGNFTYKNTARNVEYFLNNHPKYKGKIKYDTYTSTDELNGEKIDDFLLSEMRADIEDCLCIRGKEQFKDGLNKVLKANKYNKVQEFIKGIKWDGKERMKTVFIDAFNVEDTDMHREMTYKWFLSGITRIFEPGYPIEGMIILTSSGGTGKSYFCNELACGFGNAIDININDTNKAVETMKSNWIINIDELDSFSKAEMTKVKTFLTGRSETTRLAYKEREQEYKRHCIFIGSTNESTFLRDYTDQRERRFWILKCNTTGYGLAKKYLEENEVSQIWAEAYHEYLRLKELDEKIDLSLDSKFVEEMTDEQQQYKTSNDDDNIERFKEILEGFYYTPKNGEYFACEQDFISQTKEGYNEGNKDYHQINVIPVAWVTDAMGVKYKSQTLETMVKGIWETRQKKYAGQNKRCWVRVNKIEFSNEFSSDSNALPF